MNSKAGNAGIGGKDGRRGKGRAGGGGRKGGVEILRSGRSGAKWDEGGWGGIWGVVLRGWRGGKKGWC